MSYRLFIDDIRTPPKDGTEYIVARSSRDAMDECALRGIPEFISFDHDLGGEDTVMVFLKNLEEWDNEAILYIKDYVIHSANPVGSQNIYSFMTSWRKSLDD